MLTEQTEGAPPPANPELDALQSSTRSADAEPAQPGGAQPGAQPGGAQPAGPALSADEQEAAEWAFVPRTMGQIISRALPEVKDDWSREHCLEWGREFVPLARKYGWTFNQFMAWLGPWVGVAIASERMLTPTILAGHQRIKDARAKAAAAAKPADATPGDKAPATA